jgi:hypothetical protein
MGKYKRCRFYEATHLSCFEKELIRIFKDKNIDKPEKYHPMTERLCRDSHLEEILRASWEIHKHLSKEPTYEQTPEYREWIKEDNELRKNLRCESTCKMSEWCAFYQNEINYILTYTDMTSYDDEKVYFDWNHSREMDRGFLKSSFLYKNFIKPPILKELPPVKNDKTWKKLDDWQYSIYEKIFEQVKYQPKLKQSVLKYVLDILMQQEKPGDLIMTYLLGKSLTFDLKLLQKKWKELDIDFERHFKTLKNLNLIGTLEQTTEVNKVRSLTQKFTDSLSSTSDKMIEVDITFLLEYIKQRRLEFFDPFYEWYLWQEKNPSRKNIEDKFKITQPTQIMIERRLNIRKDFRNKETTQLTNLYWTNHFVLDAIFKFLSTADTKEKFEKISKINKKIILNKRMNRYYENNK